MASSEQTATFIAGQVSKAGRISLRKMFGEYAVYCNEKVVAFICDDELFVKPTEAGKNFIQDFTEGFPYPGAKPHLLVSGDKWDSREWLTKLISITEQALPTLKPKNKAIKK